MPIFLKNLHTMKTLPIYVDFAQIFFGFYQPDDARFLRYTDIQFFSETKNIVTRGLAVYQFSASSPETPISVSGLSGTL